MELEDVDFFLIGKKSEFAPSEEAKITKLLTHLLRIS